jgi:hypothetical protein
MSFPVKIICYEIFIMGGYFEITPSNYFMGLDLQLLSSSVELAIEEEGKKEVHLI